MTAQFGFMDIYQRLFAAHGPQRWWPSDDGPFEVMVGAVLTQNTSWRNVERAIHNLKRARSLTPRAIAAAHPRRIARLLKPSGYFNVKTRRLRAFCRWYLEEGGYEKLRMQTTAQLRTGLLGVSGIGPETADDILLYAFARPVFVIDAYTRRLFRRLGLIEGSENYEVLREQFEHALKKNHRVYNEYHALIVRHAKDVCRNRPRCAHCCLAFRCPENSATGSRLLASA